MESVYTMTLVRKKYLLLPGGDSFIILSDLTEKTVWKNSACNLYDLGDEVVGLHGIQKWVVLAARYWKL